MWLKQNKGSTSQSNESSGNRSRAIAPSRRSSHEKTMASSLMSSFSG